MANKYQNNQQGVIKAPNAVKNDPKSDKKVGNDLRVKQSNKK